MSRMLLTPKEFYEGHDSRSVGGNSSIHDQNTVTHIVIPPIREEPAYTHHGKGVNFFLRMGLISKYNQIFQLNTQKPMLFPIKHCPKK